MLFSLRDFLIAVSKALDFVEMDLLGVTLNHSKRVAYIAFKLAEEFGLTIEEKRDIISLSILHDNGLTEGILKNKVNLSALKKFPQEENFKDHCVIGERNIVDFPLFSKKCDIIKFHHENYDGSGFFGLKNNEIPFMAQLIGFADRIDFLFNYENPNEEKKVHTIQYAKKEKGKRFSPEIVDGFLKIVEDPIFWTSLKNESIEGILYDCVPEYKKDISLDEILEIMKVFSKIIDSKSNFTQRHSSGLAKKVRIMAEHYDFSYDEKMKLIIAAQLHDIGKLAIPNAILDKPGKLTNEEISTMQKHAYYTRMCLKNIDGFEEITMWASNHHEKLNGKGYPFGLKDEELDFNSRLMACLDIYQALTEERPYRNSLSHESTMNILRNMVNNNHIDTKIVKDIQEVFQNKEYKNSHFL